MAALEEALELAKAENFCRTFVDEGVLIAPLLYEASARGIAPAYAGSLLAAMDGAECDAAAGKTTGGAVSGSHHEQLVEPLSQRELEILALVADGLSNQEIAQKLYITLRTVKWHTSNIYGKLTVRNRTQAVARGRQFGLI
jgi:LuxR family maltose regulon positive regulatory protein